MQTKAGRITEESSRPFYVWHDVKYGSVVTSGLCFTDFLLALHQERGLLILRQGEWADPHDGSSEFKVVQPESVDCFAREDIYSWGDFYWADFKGDGQPRLNEAELVELRDFSMNALPTRSPSVASLSNNFLVAAHDDGWYARVFYTRWESIREVIATRAPVLSEPNLQSLARGDCGFWVTETRTYEEELMTFDVDLVIRKYSKR